MAATHFCFAIIAGLCFATATAGQPRATPSQGALAPGQLLSPADRAERLQARRIEGERRRAWEIGNEPRIRPLGLGSGCERPLDPHAPQICLRLLGARTVAKRSPLRYRIEWRNLPRAFVALELVRAAPAGERWRYRGPSGRLPMFGPAPGDGAQDFVWDGGRLDCSSRDAMIICEDAEIGAYRLSATVRRTPQPGDPLVAAILAWTLSDEFEIGGNPDMRSVLYEDRVELGSYLERRLGFHTQFYTDELKRAPLPARAAGPYRCAAIVLVPPLRGTVRACMERRFVDRIGVTAEPEDVLLGGEIGYLPGLVSQPRARDIARRRAMRGYERAADHVGYPGIAEARRGGGGDERNNPRTWLDTDVQGTAYRHEGGGYWLFAIDQMVKTMRGDGLAGPWDRLLIKVEPDGTACLVGRGPMASYNPGIRASRPPGGMTLAQARPNYDPQRWRRPCPRRPARRRR